MNENKIMTDEEKINSTLIALREQAEMIMDEKIKKDVLAMIEQASNVRKEDWQTRTHPTEYFQYGEGTSAPDKPFITIKLNPSNASPSIDTSRMIGDYQEQPLQDKIDEAEKKLADAKTPWAKIKASRELNKAKKEYNHWYKTTGRTQQEGESKRFVTYVATGESGYSKATWETLLEGGEAGDRRFETHTDLDKDGKNVKIENTVTMSSDNDPKYEYTSTIKTITCNNGTDLVYESTVENELLNGEKEISTLKYHGKKDKNENLSMAMRDNCVPDKGNDASVVTKVDKEEINNIKKCPENKGLFEEDMGIVINTEDKSNSNNSNNEKI